jgi:hypothetical protein
MRHKDTHLKLTFRKMAAALAAAAVLGPAQAGVLTYQDVVFTSSWTGNVLTLEIDAAHPGGDWTRATMLGALSLKDIGSFKGVTVSAAPKGADAWKLGSRELTANGCSGSRTGKRAGTALCLTGTPIALTDNMVFTFTFDGAPVLEQPHLKVNFLDASGNKVGDLLSQTIKSAPVVVTTPVTPAPVPVPAPSIPAPPVATPAIPVPVVQAPLPATPAPVAPSGSLTPPNNATAGSETGIPGAPGNTSPISVPEPVVLEPVLQQAASAEVPEPQAIALVLAGLALMGMVLRKRS